MDKQKAIELLGGTPAKAAKAMGCKSVHAVYMWPDVISQAMADRVMGAVQRLPKRRKTPTKPEAA